MTATGAEPTELVRRLRAVPAPRPMLSRDEVRRLTDRQREILSQLGALFADGFEHLTMAEIAAAVAFLGSDDSSFITASNFLVDGGISGAYVTPL